ncbi:MAG: ATP-binding cassette domain-containing protein [Erysipelotrichaceae bacterium]|nr:ATP-binding cassette domain-containing protein [Erysipelotrichaceae bacterium]
MKVEELCVSFGDKTVLDHFSAEFHEGITCLTGPSGYGKTTLLHTIAGLIRPQSGRIVDRPDKVALMFQDDRLFPWMNALQNITIVCDDESRAMHYLKAVELEQEALSMPSSLSGGMRRRIALARALAYNGDLVLLDEPFKGMDLPLVERLAPLIQSLTVPVILSTHSPEEQAIVGGRILEMDKL